VPNALGYSGENQLMEPTQFLRRDAAADYLKTKYGFGASRTLAKGVAQATDRNIARPAGSSSTGAKT
jgi:hypothetical protein